MQVRTVKCVSGAVEMACEPVFDDGESWGSWSYGAAGYDDTVFAGDSWPDLRRHANMGLGFEGRGARARSRPATVLHGQAARTLSAAATAPERGGP